MATLREGDTPPTGGTPVYQATPSHPPLDLGITTHLPPSSRLHAKAQYEKQKATSSQPRSHQSGPSPAPRPERRNATISILELNLEQTMALEILQRLANQRLADPLQESSVKALFRRLARVYHPDRHQQLSDSERHAMAQKFDEIRGAYLLLKRAFVQVDEGKIAA